MSRQLSQKQRLFIAELQKGATGVDAAKAAGYSPRTAKQAAYQLMHQNTLVRAELDRIAELVAKESELTATTAMERLDADITQAKQVNQHSAVAKFRELQFKLAGLLREKLDVTVERVDINDALASARARVEQTRPPCDPSAAIEGEFQALPSSAGRGSIDNKSTRLFGD